MDNNPPKKKADKTFSRRDTHYETVEQGVWSSTPRGCM